MTVIFFSESNLSVSSLEWEKRKPAEFGLCFISGVLFSLPFSRRRFLFRLLSLFYSFRRALGSLYKTGIQTAHTNMPCLYPVKNQRI